ncbi:hypothetical protein CK203_055013 [Vitis vinifera]|uniref:Uncharacterized protein n=1 Tax=Vitis vinifera TaxID=29760 RepID=A0A438GIF8_VITVI|nr:hypothetical protein CK203_055013 [Vitis vinifera]
MASRPSHPSSPSPNFLYWENEKVRLDYRPVHMNPLTMRLSRSHLKHAYIEMFALFEKM